MTVQDSTIKLLRTFYLVVMCSLAVRKVASSIPSGAVFFAHMKTLSLPLDKELQFAANCLVVTRTKLEKLIGLVAMVTSLVECL